MRVFTSTAKLTMASDPEAAQISPDQKVFKCSLCKDYSSAGPLPRTVYSVLKNDLSTNLSAPLRLSSTN